MPKVIIDKHIPFIEGRLEPLASVQYVAPEDITATVVRDADVLVVRTRTRCDARLLEGSRVRFIATATIGYDHIDTGYCRTHGIGWTNAPGCNAQGVCDYVMTAIGYAERVSGKRYRTLGVAGVGHVGKLVAEAGRRRGMEVLLCDPPRAEREGGNGFVGLDELIAKADIISLHTPLTYEGKHATWHLINEARIAHLRSGCLLINAARGGVVDERALLDRLNKADTAAGAPDIVIDCWKGEPHINGELVQKALLATFHIAGYTRQGKINASEMCIKAVTDFLCTGKGDNSPANCCTIQQNDLTLQPQTDFDIEALSRQLKAQPALFERLRESYPLR